MSLFFDKMNVKYEQSVRFESHIHVFGWHCR